MVRCLLRCSHRPPIVLGNRLLVLGRVLADDRSICASFLSRGESRARGGESCTRGKLAALPAYNGTCTAGDENLFVQTDGDGERGVYGEMHRTSRNGSGSMVLGRYEGAAELRGLVKN